jgi:hypothetical protein
MRIPWRLLGKARLAVKDRDSVEDGHLVVGLRQLDL